MLLARFCGGAGPEKPSVPAGAAADTADTLAPPPALQAFLVVPRDVTIRRYFQYMEEAVQAGDSLVPYRLDEYLLALANPRLIDSLAETDYYRRKARGELVINQMELVVLRQGDTLFLPDSAQAAALLFARQNTWIDVNIPEFRLRIVDGSDTLYSFPVRVGQNRRRFLAAAGHEVDLRTRTGRGKIIRVNRGPIFIEPVSGKRYTRKMRDDGITTQMPRIPWLEPELNGQRYGQLIHPMPNPRTLGKPTSNGCIGLNESDAWRLYYHAPLGTPVVVRYDLQVVGARGDTITLPDVYARGGVKR